MSGCDNLPTGAGNPEAQAAEIELLKGQVKEMHDQKEGLEETVARAALAAKLVQEKLADSLAKVARTEDQMHHVQQEAQRLEVENYQMQVRHIRKL